MLAVTGCDVLRQVGSAYNFVNCKYEYNSVSAMSIAGIDLSKGVSLLQLPKVTGILTGAAQSIPLDFTVNLNVTNPNATAAAMSGMQYVLSIDNIKFTSGQLDKSLNIASGATEVMPMRISLDLKTLLTGDSGNAVLGIVKNIIGIGNEKSDVKLELKPTFMVSGVPVTSPAYIPVSFSFGGMN